MGGKFSRLRLSQYLCFDKSASSSPTTPVPENQKQNVVRNQFPSSLADQKPEEKNKGKVVEETEMEERQRPTPPSYLSVGRPQGANNQRSHSVGNDGQFSLDLPPNTNEGRRYTTGVISLEEERQRRRSKVEAETPKCYVVENRRASDDFEDGGESEIILVASTRTNRRYSLALTSFYPS